MKIELWHARGTIGSRQTQPSFSILEAVQNEHSLESCQHSYQQVTPGSPALGRGCPGR